jgi:arginine utilization protein RocB
MVEEARGKHGVVLRTSEFFAGLCDLSYLGISGLIGYFAKNRPAADRIFHIPFDDMAEIDMPVMNLSTRGYDAHSGIRPTA